MKLITRQDMANHAAQRWHNTYSPILRQQPGYLLADGRSPKDIDIRLEALGPKPPPDQVDEVIGYSNWTHPKCFECENEVDAVVELGRDDDPEWAPALICHDCLRKALAMLD